MPKSGWVFPGASATWTDLRHRDIVGFVQQGRGGFGLGESRPSWHKAAPSQRRDLVVEEVSQQEQAAKCAKAVSQAKQGQWSMEAFHISFILRATYDVLPSPSNLKQWYGEDPMCPLFSSPANLKHILVGCKTSLTQGRYTWRHNNKVLKCLPAMLEPRRTTVLSPSSHPTSARVCL